MSGGRIALKEQLVNILLGATNNELMRCRD